MLARQPYWLAGSPHGAARKSMPEELADIPFDSPPADLPVSSTFESAAPPRRDAPRVEPVLGRVLPHSLESESMLLSCCLIDGPDVIPRCLDAQIGPESFYGAQHGIVFQHLLALHGRQQAITVEILAEELKTARQFEAVGGYPFLMEISRESATTAQAAYFIEKVREQALLREIIRSATGTVEDCYGFSGGIDEFIQESAQKMQRIVDRGSSADLLMERLEQSRYDPARRLPDVAPVYWLGKVPICTRGNLVTITAVTKVGKSSFTAGMMAAAFRDPDHGQDTFTVRSENPRAAALIHFDTEQHAKHHERMLDGVMRRAGALKLPPWFASYARKGTTADQLRAELEAVLKSAARRHHAVHSVFLDGVADLVNDVNDPREVNPFVAWLEGLAVRYDCPIVCILHLNPVTSKDSVQKSRGHLGSQLQRKAETDIRLKKETEQVTVVYTEPQGTRGQPVFEKDGPRFQWDAQEQMHVTCRAPEDLRAAAKKAELMDLVDETFQHAKADRLRYADFMAALQVVADIGTKRAEARFSEFKRAGCIAKDMLGLWARVTL